VDEITGGSTIYGWWQQNKRMGAKYVQSEGWAWCGGAERGELGAEAVTAQEEQAMARRGLLGSDTCRCYDCCAASQCQYEADTCRCYGCCDASQCQYVAFLGYGENQ
jgi:hypothetical protein